MSFINDMEKMYDFVQLSKDEFLKSYSYLTEEEYDETREELNRRIEKYDIDSIVEETKEFLKKSEDYCDMRIDYVLEDIKNKENSIIFATHYDEGIEIYPYTNTINNLAEWAFSFDEELFKNLENNKIIHKMELDVHYAVWQEIESTYPEEINNIEGMQLYLKYCKENNIDKSAIEKTTNMEVPDVMKYYIDKSLDNKKHKQQER